jgi:hypothetical protein
MKLPTIHLNGTSGAELMAQAEAAHLAVLEAIEAVAKACPNARDYYPQGDNAYKQAAHEHGERLFALQAVQRDLEELWLHLSDEIDARRSRSA